MKPKTTRALSMSLLKFQRHFQETSGMMFQAGPACLPVACRSFVRLDGFIGRWLGLSLSDEPVRNC